MLPDVCDSAAGAVEQALYELLRRRLEAVLVVPTPSAGATWSLTVPAGTLWEVVSVSQRLTSSAVVANRVPQVTFTDPQGNTLFTAPAAGTQPQSVLVRYAWGEGYDSAINIGSAFSAVSLPRIALPTGYAVNMAVANLDVGDTITQPVVVVRAWDASGIGAQAEWIDRRAGR